jgi:ribosomal protein S12 methylthiotransferase accessory factor
VNAALNVHTAKAYFAGTHRTRAPEETWQIVAPKLSHFGITRVADVTELDAIGIPVVMAARPLGKILSVTQGKGQTRLLAKVSAVMEAIEDWHAELHHPPVTAAATPAAALELDYDVRDLPRVPGSLLTPSMTLDWIDAVNLHSGRPTLLPKEAVCCGNEGRRWHPSGLVWTSNGLASGNCREEAVLHALYEIIERDAVSMLADSGVRTVIDPESVDEEACRHLIDRIQRAGMRLRLVFAPSRFGVPCFVAWIWGSDFPLPMQGYGAHISPVIALSRAITEAAQTRLTAIAGSRDDIDDDFYNSAGPIGGGLFPAPPAIAPWPALAGAFTTTFADTAAELEWLCGKLAALPGGTPLLVDLSTDADIAVVKVIVPGALFDLQRVHPTAEFGIDQDESQTGV